MEKKVVKKSLITRMAKAIGKASVNSACALWYYQPKVPKAMKEEKK